MSVAKIIIYVLFIYNQCITKTFGIEPPQVFIPDQGTIFGTYLKMFRTQNIKAFLGIKYADALRFSPPEIYTVHNENIFNATSFAPDCWQTSVNHSHIKNSVLNHLLRGETKAKRSLNKFDENCLSLNIFVPSESPGMNGYAVIVWIHAGDFSYGSSTDIDPFQFVFKQKVIIVTISYRLNIFGFLSTGDGEAQGNYGLMDQSAALFWIKRNINYFGGNEGQITLMGHSSGAISIGLHLISKEWSKNTFSRAILMSGNPFTNNAIKSPKYYDHILDSLANVFGCVRRPVSLFVQCLKRVDPKILSENMPLTDWGPVIDMGYSNTSLPFVADLPVNLFKGGQFQQVPILIGITDMEDVLTLIENISNPIISNEEIEGFFYRELINDIPESTENEQMCFNNDIILDALGYVYKNDSNSEKFSINAYINFVTDKMYLAPMYSLAYILSKYKNVYVYYFNIRPKTPFYEFPDWIKVPKFYDQVYVWGIPFMNNNKIVKDWDSMDKKISNIIMTLWANFVKTSNPTISNVYIKWNTFNDKSQNILYINPEFQLKSISNDHKIKFWNEFYPNLLKFATECCNYTSFSASYCLYINNSSNILFIFYLYTLTFIFYKYY